MRKLIFILFIFAISSCRPVEIIIDSPEKAIFLESTDMGFYRDGLEALVFSPELHQISANPKRKLFRLQNDSQSEFVNVILDEKPRSLGVNIIINVTYLDGEEIISFMQIYECSKINSQTYWLWNSETKTGFIIPLI